MNILIADDELVPRQILQFQLEQAGFTVLAAENGAQAWELLQAHDCSLVITDWMMPEMTGLELIQKIRQSNRSGYVYAILLTSKSERDALVTGMTTGADDFVTKPFDTRELLARLQPGLRIIELERRLDVRNQQLSHTNSLMKRDLNAAAQIQQAFLPQRALNIPNVSVAWHYSPCTELAGDMLNVLPLDADHVGVFVLDVSGHGVQAALLAVSACRYLSNTQDPSSVLWERSADSTTYQLRAPAAVLRELNSRMTPQSLSEQYFTLFYGILNHRTGEFRYSSAGHPAPAHLSAQGNVSFLPGEGLPIGIAESDYDEHRLQLHPGERVIFYSDGLTECMNPAHELFGNHRLAATLIRTTHQSINAVVPQILKELDSWLATEPIHDDISIVALEFVPQASRGGSATAKPHATEALPKQARELAVTSS